MTHFFLFCRPQGSYHTHRREIFERKEKTRRHLEIKYFKNNSFDKRKNKKQNRYKAKDKSKRVTRLIVDIIPVRVKRDKKTVQSTLCVCVFVGHL
jgi:hypothetical protein